MKSIFCKLYEFYVWFERYNYNNMLFLEILEFVKSENLINVLYDRYSE